MTNIEQALIDISTRFNFDADRLIAYSYEDGYGGYHSTEALAKWPCGSIWEVEGRILYALVRALNAKTTAEIGVFLGCGSTHIAAALKANGGGKHHACDINSRVRVNERDYDTGGLIPDALRSYVAIHNTNGLHWLQQNKVDFIFDDGAHNTDETRQAWQIAAKQLAPGGMIVTHDATHFLVGKAIQDGIMQSGVAGYELYSVQPSDCGIAVWRKPGTQEPTIETVSEQLEVALIEGRNNAKLVREGWQRFVPPADEPEIETVFADDMPDLETMTRAELREYAKQQGIKDADTRSKRDLLEELKSC